MITLKRMLVGIMGGVTLFSMSQLSIATEKNLSAQEHDDNLAGFVVIPKQINLEKSGDKVGQWQIPLRYYAMNDEQNEVVTLSTADSKVELTSPTQEEPVIVTLYNHQNEELSEGLLAEFTSTNSESFFSMSTLEKNIKSFDIYKGTMTFNSSVDIVNQFDWEIKGETSLKPTQIVDYELIAIPSSLKKQQVNWTISGTSSTETKIDSNTGKLTVGLDEQEGNIKISATSGASTYTKEVSIQPLVKDDEFDYDGYKWLVMKRENNQALIVTKDVQGAAEIKYNPSAGATNSYKNSDLKKAIDGFYDGLVNLKQVALPVEITDGNSNESTTVVQEGVRSAFALSLGDINDSWTSNEQRKAGKNNQAAKWWLRSKTASNVANYIKESGEINKQGANLYTAYIRPALYIQLGDMKEQLELTHSHEEQGWAKPSGKVQYTLWKDGKEVSPSEVEFDIHIDSKDTVSNKTSVSNIGELSLGLNEQSEKIIVKAVHNGQTVSKHVEVLPLETMEVIEIDEIDWLVLKLDRDNQQALLITNEVQGETGIVFNEEGGSTLYSGSKLETQMQSFYDEKLKTIKEHALPVNLPDKHLGENEIRNKTSVASHGVATAFALSLGDLTEEISGNSLIGEDSNGLSQGWWLRTERDPVGTTVYYVNDVGTPSKQKIDEEAYLRPAVFVNLDDESYSPWQLEGPEYVITGQINQFNIYSEEINVSEMPITWELLFANSPMTHIDERSGLLTVAKDETATSVRVVATTNGKQTAIKEVNIEQPMVIKKVTVKDTDLDITEVWKEAIQGEKLEFLSNFSNDEKVEWEVNGSSNIQTKFTGNLLTVYESESAASLKITAKSKGNPANKAEYTLAIQEKLKFTDNSTTIKPLEEKTYATNFKNIVFDFSLVDESINKHEPIKEKDITSNGENGTFTIDVPITAMIGFDFTIKLEATHTPSDRRPQNISREIKVLNLNKIELDGITWSILSQDAETGNYFLAMDMSGNIKFSRFSEESIDYKNSTLDKMMKEITDSMADNKKYIQKANIYDQGMESLSGFDANGEARLFALTRKDFLSFSSRLSDYPNFNGWWLRTKDEKNGSVYFVDVNEISPVPNGVNYSKAVRAGGIFKFREW